MSNSSLSDDEVALISSFVRDQQLDVHFLVSSVALLVYDYLLTFQMELELIWNSRPGFVKILYLVQRYLPFIDTIVLLFIETFTSDLGPRACRALYDTSAWMYVAGVALSEVLLTMRTWAICYRAVNLTVGLPIFYLCCIVPIFFVMGVYLHSTEFVPPPIPGLICFTPGGKPILFLCWVLLMAYEAGIVTLMAITGLSAFRSGGRSALANLIYRDGISYYFFLFALSVVNVTVILVLPNDLQTLFGPHERVVHTLLTCRAILHIRKQARRNSTEVDFYQYYSYDAVQVQVSMSTQVEQVDSR